MKQVLGFEKYCVDSYGAVYSFRRLSKVRMSSQLNLAGYPYVRLVKDNKQVRRDCHKIVWEAFRGSVPGGYVIDHIDDNPRNPSLNNLQLLTKKQNAQKYWASDNTEHVREAVRLSNIKRRGEVRSLK